MKFSNRTTTILQSTILQLSLLLLVCCCASVFAGWQDDTRPKIILEEPEDIVSFSGNGTFTDYFRIFVRDGKNLLVGARNAVYNLTLPGLKLNHKLEWYSEEQDSEMCVTKGKDTETCQNYIRVLSIVGPGQLLVCGTNSFKPRCRYYNLGPDGYVQVGAQKSGQGICPYDPHHNSTSVYIDGNTFSGTVGDFTEVDPLIHRWDSLRTAQYDLKALNAPDFVNSMAFEDFVFFFFRETAEEFNNCGKTIYSRVGRVCKGDRGFPRGSSRNRWTTFFKARLNCSVPGNFPFAFDEIQSMSYILPSSQLGSNVLYGVFTTGPNSITGSAVCAFKMRDILDAFDGKFKAQPSKDSNLPWLAVDANKIPEPRPGTCVNDSTTLPDQYYMFITEGNTLMDESVQPIFGKPIVTRAIQSQRFTTIAIHTNATTPDGSSYDVLFLGTDDGKIMTAVNVGRETVKTVLVQEMQVFPGKPIREMVFLGGSPPKLLVSSDQSLKILNVRQCHTGRIKSCSDCVALQSPYCAWNKRQSKCVSIPLDIPISRRDYIQNVVTGNHTDCPKSASIAIVNQIPIEQHKSVSKSTLDRDNGLSQQNMNTGENSRTNINKEVGEDPVVVTSRSQDSYTAETLTIAVGVGCVLAVLLGFLAGWGCAKRCRKDHDLVIPYPDTDYEYFEQRHNLNVNTRLVGEGKEDPMYAEPVLDGKNNGNNVGGGPNSMNSMNNMNNMNQGPEQETTMFHFAQQPYGRELYRFDDNLNGNRGRSIEPLPFGGRQIGGPPMHMDGYGTAHRLQQANKPLPPVLDGYGTARSKKVYL